MSDTPAVPVDNTAQTEDQKAKDKLLLDQAGKSADANMGGMNNVMVFIQAFLQMLTTGNFDMESFTKTIKDTLGKDIKLPEDAADKMQTAQEAPKQEAPAQKAVEQKAEEPSVAPAQQDNILADFVKNTASGDQGIPKYEIADDLKQMPVSELLSRSILPLQSMLFDSSEITNYTNVLGAIFTEIEEGRAEGKTIQYDADNHKLLVTDPKNPDAAPREINITHTFLTAFDQDGNVIAPAPKEPTPVLTMLENGNFNNGDAAVPASEVLASARAMLENNVMHLRQNSDWSNLEKAYDAAREQKDKGYQQGVNGGALTFEVQTQPENVSVDLTGEKPSGLTGAFAGQVTPITAISVDAKVDSALVGAPAANDPNIEPRAQVTVAGLGR